MRPPDLHDALGDLDVDVPRWRALAARCGGPALVVGCGRGRVLGALRCAGCEGLGVERNPAAAAVAAGRGLQVRVGDALVLPPEPRFQLVIAPARVAEELAAQTSELTVAASLKAWLVPGGWLALAVAPPPSPGAPLVSMGVVHRLGRAHPFGPAEVLWEEHLDGSARLRSVQVWLRPDGAPPQPVARLALRWCTTASWHAALTAAGLAPAATPWLLPPDTSGLTLILARTPQ